MGKHRKRIHINTTPIEEYDDYDDKLIGEYITYTDGSCDNLSPYKAGGSAYIIIKDGKIIKTKNKGFIPTTNNRTELLAIISAVNSLPNHAKVDIFTDSQYCIRVLDGEYHKKNMDLIKLFAKVASKLDDYVFHWVRGHNGNKYNEMADELAYEAYKEISEQYNIPQSPRMKITH